MGIRLSTAIHERFEGSLAATAIPGGLWTDEVPEGTAYPYAWLDLSQVDTVYNFVSRGEYGRIGVHVYGLGADAAETAMEAFKSRFDGCKLAYTEESGFHSIFFVPLRYRLVGENLRHQTGALVFRASQTYLTLTQRPR